MTQAGPHSRSPDQPRRGHLTLRLRRPTPIVRGRNCEVTRRCHPPADSPHNIAHGARDFPVSAPPFPPSLTHGEGRVSGHTPHHHPHSHPIPFPHPHHLVGRHVPMQFGSRWYRGLVTDHDVSTGSGPSESPMNNACRALVRCVGKLQRDAGIWDSRQDSMISSSGLVFVGRMQLDKCGENHWRSRLSA